MKKALLLLFVSLSLLVTAQTNLVPNPSFEVYIQCPDNISGIGDDQISRASGWQTYRETPDYYNTCGSIWNVSVPNNQTGFQYPHTGNAYSGLATYYIIGEYREFIGAQLSSSLLIGQKYYLSFYVSLAGKQGASMASNNIGARFHNNPYNYVNAAPINNFAHLSCNSLITDTTNWSFITGSFIADSAYSYISLGNFFDDSNTDTLRIDDNPFTGYYYIDDVCVSTDSIYAGNWTKANDLLILEKKIILFPNPFTDMIYIKSDGKSSLMVNPFNCRLFDLQGNLKLEKEFDSLSETAFINTINISPGSYMLIIQIENCFLKKLIIKQ